MNRPGDWKCRACQHLNFQRRESCQRCGDSKYVDFGGLIINNGGRGGGSSSSSFGFMINSNNNISNNNSDVRPGDWYCGAANCGAHNFASRSSCFKCGAFKDDILLSSAFSNDFLLRSRAFGGATTTAAFTRPASWKSGDWICNRSGCNEHNFASRMECFKCSAPRDTY